MIRLIQVRNPGQQRRVAIAEDSLLRFLRGVESVYALAQQALAEKKSLEQTAAALVGSDTDSYDAVLQGDSAWRLLPAFDHPHDPARCLVTGTGLTHRASAENRQAMHKSDKTTVVTDSMRMYQAGVEGGRPASGCIGVAPEWFYKGCGTILRAHGEPLEVPSFGMDGGEESEVAGAYIIDGAGTPRRVGLALGNEFSDHKLEKISYLHLAPSKLRTCAIGPELIAGGEFNDARGNVRILRAGKVLWSKPFRTGEKNMSHTV